MQNVGPLWLLFRGAVLAFVVYFDDKSYNRWPPDPRPRAPRGEKVGQAPGSVGSREHYRPYVGPRCIMAASRASPTRAGKLFRAESFPRCAPQQDWALPPVVSCDPHSSWPPGREHDEETSTLLLPSKMALAPLASTRLDVEPESGK